MSKIFGKEGDKMVRARFICSLYLALVVVLVCCLCFEASAIMKALSTEKLTRTSQIIILGKVGSVKAQWSEDGKKIVTRAFVTITEVIRGKTTGRNVVVEYDGGEIDGIGLKVSDVSPLYSGERVLLFLRPGKKDENVVTFNVVGKAQGKYTVGRDGIARKKGFSLMGEKYLVDNHVPLDELIRKIRAVKLEQP
jgi:hypothetical protein